MKKTIFGVAAFAVFATSILLLSQVAQPVSIQAMDQQKDLDQLEKEAKAFKEELEPFAKALSEDVVVNELFGKLKQNPTVTDLIDKIKSTDANEDNAEKLKDYAEELCNYLSINEDAQELQGILGATYAEMLTIIESRYNQLLKDFEDEKVSEETLKEQLAQEMEEMDLEKNPDSTTDWMQQINDLINLTILIIGAAVVVLVIIAVVFLMGFCAAIGAIILAVILGYVCEFIFNIVGTVLVIIIIGIIVVIETIDQILRFFGIHASKESPVAKNVYCLPSNSNALLNAIFKMLAKLRTSRLL